MRLKTIEELLFLILLNGLLASSNPQNYGTNSRYLSNRNATVTRSRKIDGFDKRQSGMVGDVVSKNRNDGCNEIFCENDPNYPKNYIQSLNLDKFELFFGEDFVDNVALRFDADEQGLCQSRRRLIYPNRAMTASGTWLTIVNSDDNYRQGILVEECTRQFSRCDYSENLPLSVHSTCKQNFMYRYMVAISSDGKPIREQFQFPSCCKCFITVGHRSNNQPDPNPIRFGGDDEDEKRKRSGEKYVLPY